jgi:hypothetical protein
MLPSNAAHTGTCTLLVWKYAQHTKNKDAVAGILIFLTVWKIQKEKTPTIYFIECWRFST